MNLNLFMKNGIYEILTTGARFYFGNRKGRAFLRRVLPQIKASAVLREEQEELGTHIPPFLIASIASQCNLRCAGCYARAGGTCRDTEISKDLTGEEWHGVFDQASKLGVSFILLAGGEPLLRRDVLEAAAQFSNMIFPVFTNGTMIDDSYAQLFDENRNLIPIFSVEGNQKETDIRRGAGIHTKVEAAMLRLKEQNILFGVSVTVTKENKNTVLESAFVSDLRAKGCGIVFYVEYVPVEKGTELLVLNSAELEELQKITIELKRHFRNMVILSFPGDEAAMGGCLASGRGFFHINPKGGAEPCPFSPYAKYNLKQSSMLQILRSEYFKELRQIAAQADIHTGGCVLFEKEDAVQSLLTSCP